ncbi:MAG: low specificity L-threonine aldolase [Myxococcales bacterium]
MDTRFASDNTAGICPEAWQALRAADAGNCASYGEDAWTLRAAEAIRGVLGSECDVYFVFNGTAANSLALAACCQSYNSVICADVAHIVTDECGAPEFFSNGTKLLAAVTVNGKVTPSEVERLVTQRSDLHYPKPRVLSLTLPTELGTAYSLSELGELAAAAKRHGLIVHLDGARFANAVVSLGVSPAELVEASGADVLCFGAVKNGLGFGEAVVFRNHALSAEFSWRCKQAGQLASKMRYLAAPWVAGFESDLWLKNAANANRCARLLGERLAALPGARLAFPVEGNAVFAELSAEQHARLRAAGWSYYTFIGSAARFVCSWATTPRDVDALLATLGA